MRRWTLLGLVLVALALVAVPAAGAVGLTPHANELVLVQLTPLVPSPAALDSNHGAIATLDGLAVEARCRTDARRSMPGAGTLGRF